MLFYFANIYTDSNFDYNGYYLVAFANRVDPDQLSVSMH